MKNSLIGISVAFGLAAHSLPAAAQSPNPADAFRQGQEAASRLGAYINAINQYGDDLVTGSSNANRQACVSAHTHMKDIVEKASREGLFASQTALGDKIIAARAKEELANMDYIPCPTSEAFQKIGKSAFSVIPCDYPGAAPNTAQVSCIVKSNGDVQYVGQDQKGTVVYLSCAIKQEPNGLVVDQDYSEYLTKNQQGAKRVQTIGETYIATKTLSSNGQSSTDLLQGLSANGATVFVKQCAIAQDGNPQNCSPTPPFVTSPSGFLSSVHFAQNLCANLVTKMVGDGTITLESFDPNAARERIQAQKNFLATLQGN